MPYWNGHWKTRGTIISTASRRLYATGIALYTSAFALLRTKMNTDHHLYHADPTKSEELCPYCKAQRLEKKVAELETKANLWKTRYLLVKGINAGLKAKLYQTRQCLKGKCPVCKEDLSVSCYGQSTSCMHCGFELEDEDE
jgi:hypothetical protein